MHKLNTLTLVVCFFSSVQGYAMDPDAVVMVAVRSKSAEDMRVALTKDVHINLRHADCSGHTLLSEAVGSGDHEKVALLLQDPTIELDTPLERNYTVLHIAAHTKLGTIARMLVARGANSRSVNEYGRTPLHEALYAGCPETALVLLTQIPHSKIKQLNYFNVVTICLVLEMCFKRFANGDGVALSTTIPKDVRKMLREYTIQGFFEPLKSLATEHVEHLVPILFHTDAQGMTPLEIEITHKRNEQFNCLRSQLKVRHYTYLEELITEQLCQEFQQLVKHPNTVIQTERKSYPSSIGN